jgi:hypothetical protein
MHMVHAIGVDKYGQAVERSSFGELHEVRSLEQNIYSDRLLYPCICEKMSVIVPERTMCSERPRSSGYLAQKAWRGGMTHDERL